MKQKYIPGDWVKFEGKLARVEEVYQSYYFLRIDFESYNPSIDLDFPYVYKGDEEIKPIPLTPEILEKSGWSNLEECPHAFVSGDMKIVTQLGVSSLYFNGTKILSFEYVHELQHLFFGLGINHEMEL